MKEKWYGTDYNESLLDKEAQINRWTKCMQGDSEWATQVFLPKKNPFVATDFTLREKVKTESVEGEVGVKAVPQLIEYITTEVTEVEEEEDVVVTTDDVKVVVEAEVVVVHSSQIEQVMSSQVRSGQVYGWESQPMT